MTYSLQSENESKEDDDSLKADKENKENCVVCIGKYNLDEWKS